MNESLLSIICIASAIGLVSLLMGLRMIVLSLSLQHEYMDTIERRIEEHIE